MKQSPFTDNRFEFEVRHLYYIEERTYKKLEQAKPCFLLGSRGTGKTTLLRSLSWRERISNTSLRSQLKRKATFHDCVGLYIKLPEVQISSIREWLSSAPEELQRVLFSRYLELVQLQELVTAVMELQAGGQFAFTADAEFESIRQILLTHKTQLYAKELSPRIPSSLAELADSIRALRASIERSTQVGIAPLDVFKHVDASIHLGALSRDVASKLAALIVSSSRARPPIFKVCFDEAETLDKLGVVTLSTWVRLSTKPLFHVISYVSKPEALSETFLPNLTVQSADAEVIDLDEMKDGQFQEFAEGVTTLRLQDYWSKSVQMSEGSRPSLVQKFETERLLGKLNLNQLLHDTLKNSVSPLARQLLASAAKPGGQRQDDSDGGDDSALPIFETYLQLKRARSVAPDSEAQWQKRSASSQFIRKANVAAFLSLMKELNTAPKYAYADMVLQLSDNCIRDFLMNLEYVYRASKQDLENFLRGTPIRIGVQNEGIKAASKAKRDSLPTSGVNHPSATAKLIRGLGELTAMLQRQSSDGTKHLRVTERGIFQISAGAEIEKYRRARELLSGATEAGFLKIINTTDASLNFRVHTSLAPEFGFSYRGAYYAVSLQLDEILAVADARDDGDIARITQSIFRRVDGVVTAEMFS